MVEARRRGAVPADLCSLVEKGITDQLAQSKLPHGQMRRVLLINRVAFLGGVERVLLIGHGAARKLLGATARLPRSTWNFVICFAPRRQSFAVLFSAMLLPSICLIKKAALCGFLRLTLMNARAWTKETMRGIKGTAAKRSTKSLDPESRLSVERVLDAPCRFIYVTGYGRFGTRPA